MFKLLISELERWLCSKESQDIFVVTPTLEKMSGQSSYEIDDKIRTILFHSLDQHFHSGLRLCY